MNEEKLIKTLIREAEIRGGRAERLRIASELHDSVSQNLTIMQMYANILEVTEMGSAEFFMYLKELRTIAEESQRHVRFISKGITGLGSVEDFMSRLFRLSDRYNGMSRVKVLVEESGMHREFSNKMVMYHVYCIIQEFIHNSIRHANAKLIRIQLFRSPDQLNVLMYDDGCGFNKQEIDSPSGLVNIENRLKEINARFDFSSREGCGTELKFLVNA